MLANSSNKNYEVRNVRYIHSNSGFGSHLGARPIGVRPVITISKNKITNT